MVADTVKARMSLLCGLSSRWPTSEASGLSANTSAAAAAAAHRASLVRPPTRTIR